MSYRREVENLLGKECITELLIHVREGKINDQQMKDFVLQLGELSKTSHEDPNILFGKHSIRMNRDKERELDTELHEVMKDWWLTSLYQMTRSAAMETLVKALSHSDVGCNPLAFKLSSWVELPRATPPRASHKKQPRSSMSRRVLMATRPDSTEAQPSFPKQLPRPRRGKRYPRFLIE